MFDNHCFCFSLTHESSAACAGIAWSMFTLPLHSEWLFSAALVCASLLLYSGLKSTQFVFFMIDYFLCCFVLPLKLSGSIKSYKVWLSNFLWWSVWTIRSSSAYSLDCSQNADDSFKWCNTIFLPRPICWLALLPGIVPGTCFWSKCFYFYTWTRALGACLICAFALSPSLPLSLSLCLTFRWEFWAESVAENL